MIRRSRALLAFPLVAVLGGTTLVGCSKVQNEVSKELVCESADDLAEGTREIAIEIRVRDLDDAQEEARDLRRSYDRLLGRLDGLSNKTREQIEPLLQPADEAIAALEAATSLDEMSAALDEGRAAIEALASTTNSAVPCDD